MAQVVDIGVVTWNTASLTVDALRRLLSTDQGCEFHILVHDNSSTDGTADAIEREVPEAQVVRGDRNIGFAAAVNLLLERSDTPWFFALNSDAWPEPQALARLLDRAERQPRAALVAPLLLRPDGAVEHSTHPFPSLAVAAVDALGARRLMPHWAENHCLQGAWAHDRARPVDWVVGAAMLMRRAALDDVGGLDDRFFMYVEDLEWCWRAHQRGWDVWFDPTAVVRHVGNASGERRFGERRSALEARHLRWFTDDALGPTRARRYQALQAVALGRQYLQAAAAGDGSGAAHWRLQLRAALGFLPPPVLNDPGDEPAAPSSEGVEVAVVVPTRGRAARLERLVGALAAQTLPHQRFEVVVVDDASEDATPEVLAALVARGEVPLRTLRTARGSGPASARNLGWRAATAPVIAFTDDDCVPDAGWLAAGLAALDGGARAVVGRTEPPEDQLHLAGLPFARVMEVDSARFFETCNVFYRRRDLESVGGFDPRFRRPSGEDTHLGLRVTELGVEPVFAEDALVRHDVRPGGLRDVLSESIRWDDLPLVFKDRAYARRERVHRIFFWKATHPPTILAVAGVVIGARWRPALALGVPWMWERLVRNPVCEDPGQRLRTLPGAFAVDLAEVATMVRGSWRHRTPLL